ncbi:hypothetical protein ZHAWSFBX_CDS_0010 [Agrobacterium phage Alfirin]|nr:hypothetical protein ZHAWSFBX_CDS_0010 [Agrobacterium phage Alfirin]
MLGLGPVSVCHLVSDDQLIELFRSVCKQENA